MGPQVPTGHMATVQAEGSPVSKYKAIRTEIDGIWFDSKREADVYLGLKALQRAGAIRSLELQVKFPLNGVEANTGKAAKVCLYVADFVFQDLDGRTNVYDAKGCKTAVYKIKKRWFELQYGLRIIEV